VQCPREDDLFAESSHADLYAAVDDLTDKLDRQVNRYKTKAQDHHHIAAKRQLSTLSESLPHQLRRA
jgi:ribosome-associated translation inhibitor RaiA